MPTDRSSSSPATRSVRTLRRTSQWPTGRTIHVRVAERRARPLVRLVAPVPRCTRERPRDHWHAIFRALRDDRARCDRPSVHGSEFADRASGPTVRCRGCSRVMARRPVLVPCRHRARHRRTLWPSAPRPRRAVQCQCHARAVPPTRRRLSLRSL